MSDTPEVTICPTCEGAGNITVLTPEGLTGTLCPTCDGLGDTAGELEIIPPPECICTKSAEAFKSGFATGYTIHFELDPQCPEHGPEFERYMLNGWIPGHSITEDENNE